MTLNDNIYFYSEDGTKFKSKISAIEYSQKTEQKINFYFHDDLYKAVDWRKQLPEDLNYYYKQQALRLREKYDYLVLYYSGGCDSTNILETFVYNNIKLDKIVVVGAFSKDSSWGVDENHNAEIYHNAIPYLKELDLMNITDIVDYTDYICGEKFKDLSIYQYGHDWIYEIGSHFSVHHFFWRDSERILTPHEWKDKKVGFIFGIDKPDFNNPYVCFCDPAIIQYGNSGGFGGSERVSFYWDVEYTDLLVKQIQVLKERNFSSKNQNLLAKELYSLKKNLSFHSPKSGNYFLSLRDEYIRKEKDTELFKFYFAGLENLDKKVGFDSIFPVNSIFHQA